MPEPAPPVIPISKRRMPILVRHAISLAVVFAIAIPLSYYAAGRINRSIQLDKLTHADDAVFHQGQAYVLMNAATDDAVLEKALEAIDLAPPQRSADLILTLALAHKQAVIDTPESVLVKVGPTLRELSVLEAFGLFDSLDGLGTLDHDQLARELLSSFHAVNDQVFLSAVDLAEPRLIWSKDRIPRDRWVRWLSILSRAPAEQTQGKAARLLGAMPDTPTQPGIIDALGRLAKSSYPSVRSQTLRACAGYAAIVEDPAEYEQLIFGLGLDADATIARQAWLVIGHLNPRSGFAVDWMQAEPDVAAAMLWSATRTAPEQPIPALQALRVPKLAAHALLAIEQAKGVDFLRIKKTGDYTHALAYPKDSSNHLAVWRSLFALSNPMQAGDDWPGHLRSYLDTDASPTEAFTLSLASIYRLNSADLPAGFTWTPEQIALAKLAAIEGRSIAPRPRDAKADLGPLAHDEPNFAALVESATGLPHLNPDTAKLVRRTFEPMTFDLCVLAFANDPDALTGQALIDYDDKVQVVAALAAAMKGLRPTLISGFTADLLRKRPELSGDQLHAMTDAELADLGLERIDALQAFHDTAKSAPKSANRQEEVKLLELALWMRGDLGEDFTPTAEAMLFDQSLSTPTVLMCLLHKKRPIALRYLFGDLMTTAPDLAKLFVEQRWWHVFRHFVDDADLPLWLWGDIDSQAFHFEAMRQWYAVHRWRLERGWWPDTN